MAGETFHTYAQLDNKKARLRRPLESMERVTGVEPASSAWKAEVLPLNHTREGGRGDWIRTSGPLLPKQMRYQAALHPDGLVSGAPSYGRGV